MRYKLFFGLVFILFIIPLGVAQIEDELIFKQGQQVDLQIPCNFNGSTCDNTFICNLTTNYPNSGLLVNNQEMENQTSFYNYSLIPSVLNVSGKYPNTMVCNNGQFQGTQRFVFEITKTGTILDTGESILYVLLVIAIFFFFMLSLWFTTIIPYSNKLNDRNEIVQITRLKYVKLMFVLITYGLFVWFLNSLIGLSENFITLTLFSGLVSFLFITLNNLALPFSIAILVLCGYEIIRDINNSIDIKKLGSALQP